MPVIQFDFDSIKQRIKTNLANKSEWANFLAYGVTDNLIDAFCQELTYDMQYIEYLFTENQWKLARNKSSLLTQSPLHGYIVPRKKSAVGTVRISTDKKYMARSAINVPIPKFFQFSGNNIYVASTGNYTLTNSDEYLDIECKQGEAKTVNFLAQGQEYETKIINDDSVDDDLYELYVNNILWTRVDTLFQASPTDKVYEIESKSDLSGIIIKFGNDVFGKKLELNDNVVFKYISTDGLNGNIFGSDIITNVESQAFDTNGKPVKLFCRNITSFVGGKDYPSIEEIRNLSPKVYQTGDRASNVDDYVTKIKRFPYISKVSVWGAYEYLISQNLDPWTFIPSEENVVHVALLDSVYEPLNEYEKKRVIEDLHAKCDPTDIINFENVEKIPLIFNVNAIVKNSSYILIQEKSNILNALQNEYGIENMNFDDNIYYSDFVALLDNLPSIRNHNSNILMYKEGSFFTEGYVGYESYVGGFTLPITPIDYNKVKIYIKDISEDEPQWDGEYIEMCNCDSNGNLVGVGDFNTRSSVLDLSTGIGTFVVRGSVFEKSYDSYSFRIVYGLSENDLILTNKSTIFMYGESNITVNYPK